MMPMLTLKIDGFVKIVEAGERKVKGGNRGGY